MFASHFPRDSKTSYFGSLVLILVSFGLYKVPLRGNGLIFNVRTTGLIHKQVTLFQVKKCVVAI